MILRQSRFFKRVAFLLALATCLLGVAPIHAAVSSAVPNATFDIPTPLVPSLFKRRFHRDLNRIYTFDHHPLGDRTPVVLVPGRAEEYQYAVWWLKIRRMTHADPMFEKRYKLYIFMYDSRMEMDPLAEIFIHCLKTEYATLPASRNITLVSYSLGGVIARDAMVDPWVLSRIQVLYAIAIPFHGSPLFTPKWFVENFNPSNHSPIRKGWDRFLYRSYLFNKRNLTRGLHWDHFDHSGPPFPDKPPSDQLVQAETNILPAIKRKIIVYGSYLNNVMVVPTPLKAGHETHHLVTTTLEAPYSIVNFVFPGYLLSVHLVFSYMNRVMAEIPVAAMDEQGKPTKIYPFRYNDGAIPLVSTLYLPPKDTPYSGDLEEMRQALDVQSARVFPNLDHMDFAEFHRLHRHLVTHDIFHPQEGERTPIAWLLYDLDNQKL